MPLTTFGNAKGLPKSVNDNNTLTATQPTETLRINGVREIQELFDVYLFAADGTLSHENKVLPAGAVLLPQLRQAGKKTGVFSLEFRKTNEDLAQEFTHLGLSFCPTDFYVVTDMNDLEDHFPLYPASRILMVCSNLMAEVALGKLLGVSTLLIQAEATADSNSLGIWSHYTSNSV